MVEDVVVGVVVVVLVVVVVVVVDVGVVEVLVGVVEVLVGRGTVEVVVRGMSVGRVNGAGSARSDGRSAIARAVVIAPGLSAVGPAVGVASSFPPEPFTAIAPPSAIAATASAPATATDRFRRWPVGELCVWGCVGAVDPMGGGVAGRVTVRGAAARRTVGAYAAV